MRHDLFIAVKEATAGDPDGWHSMPHYDDTQRARWLLSWDGKGEPAVRNYLAKVFKLRDKKSGRQRPVHVQPRWGMPARDRAHVPR